MTIIRCRTILGLMLALALGLALSGCSGASANPTDPAALLQRRCTVCHNMDRINAASKDRTAWLTTIDRMRGKGAKVDDAETQKLADYLVSRAASK